MSEYTSFCEHVRKSEVCTKKANYIYEKDDKKYCLRHLVSVFNQFHQSKDPAFTKCKALKDIYGYEKITKSKKKEPIKKTTPPSTEEMEQTSIPNEGSNVSINECQGITDTEKKCSLKPAYIHIISDLQFCRKHLLEKINQEQPDTPVDSLVKCKKLYKKIQTTKTDKTTPTTSSIPRPKKTKSKKQDIPVFDSSEFREQLIKSIQKKNASLELGTMLGKGAFGEVFILYDTSSKKEYAIKIAYFDSNHPKESKLALDLIYSEYMVLNNRLQYSKNKQIVQLIDHSIIMPFEFKRDIYAFMIMEKYHTSLADVFQKDSFVMDTSQIKKIGLQLIDTIEYIHKHGVLYIDMKPENIMFRDDTMSDIVMIDFGIYKSWKDHKQNVLEQVPLKGTEGTDLYACKNLNNQKSSSRIDELEMIGYLLIYMHLQGHVPWENEKNVASILKRKGEICFSTDGEMLPDYITDFISETSNYHFQDIPNYQSFRKFLLST